MSLSQTLTHDLPHTSDAQAPTTKKQKIAESWQSSNSWAGSYARVKTALSLKDATEPSEVWSLSRFHLPPQEGIVNVQIEDPVDPKVKHD